jgi:hypothetical protein
VGDALAARLASDDCPEIVIVLTHTTSGWLEEATMGVLRVELLERLRAADRCRRLRVYFVCAGTGVDVKVHSKVMIVDDEIARIGSANLNNRSMGLDTGTAYSSRPGRGCSARSPRCAIDCSAPRRRAPRSIGSPQRLDHAIRRRDGACSAARRRSRLADHTVMPTALLDRSDPCR